MILSESLLAEILDSIVVSIGQEVVQLLRQGEVLQLVHQARTVALHLLESRDCKKDDLSELLCVEGSEDTSSQDLRFLALPLLLDDHSVVLAIKHESHYVWSRHPWQLLGDDVLELDQRAHTFQSSKETQRLRISP